MENARREEFKEQIDHLKAAVPKPIVAILTADLDMDEIMENGRAQGEDGAVILDFLKDGNSKGVFVAFEVDDAKCIIQTTEVLENNDSIYKGIRQRVLMTKDQKIETLRNEIKKLEESKFENSELNISNLQKTISFYQKDNETEYYMDTYEFKRFCDIDENNKVSAGREELSGRDEFYDIEGKQKNEFLYTADNVKLEAGISLNEAVNMDFSNKLYLTKSYREIKSNVDVVELEQPAISL